MIEDYINLFWLFYLISAEFVNLSVKLQKIESDCMIKYYLEFLVDETLALLISTSTYIYKRGTNQKINEVLST